MTFLLLIVLMVLYFVPSVIAANREHRNRVAIFALNIFLGWTFLGWVAAFIWCLTGDMEPKETEPQEIDEVRLPSVTTPTLERILPIIDNPVQHSLPFPAQRNGETDEEYGARLRRLREDLS